MQQFLDFLAEIFPLIQEKILKKQERVVQLSMIPTIAGRFSVNLATSRGRTLGLLCWPEGRFVDININGEPAFHINEKGDELTLNPIGYSGGS